MTTHDNEVKSSWLAAEYSKMTEVNFKYRFKKQQHWFLSCDQAFKNSQNYSESLCIDISDQPTSQPSEATLAPDCRFSVYLQWL